MITLCNIFFLSAIVFCAGICSAGPKVYFIGANNTKALQEDDIAIIQSSPVTVASLENDFDFSVADHDKVPFGMGMAPAPSGTFYSIFSEEDLGSIREKLGAYEKVDSRLGPSYPVYLDTFVRVEVELLEDLDDKHKSGSFTHDIVRLAYVRFFPRPLSQGTDLKRYLLSKFNAMDDAEKAFINPTSFAVAFFLDNAASYRSRFPDGLRVRVTVHYRKWEGGGKEYTFSKDMVMQTVGTS